jgi:uncharacterized phage infection (PIP) family protein YhgE
MGLRPDEIKMFHSEEIPDHNPETGEIYAPGTEGYKKCHQYLEKIARNKEVGDSTEAVKHIKDLVGQIKSVKLRNESQASQEELTQLKDLKRQATRHLSLLLDDVANYIGSITAMDREGKASPESRDYDYELRAKLDDERQRKHNILINRINSAMSFISHAFGNINEDAIDEWEEENDITINIERIDLPDKIFFSDKINYKDRKQVTAWAMQVYEGLTALKKELNRQE